MFFVKHFLAEGTSITDAEAMAGYENLSAFYEHFRRQTGMTPARYRQLFATFISRAVFVSPIGMLRIIASDEAVLTVEQLKMSSSTNLMNGASEIIAEAPSGNLVKACQKELTEYFADERTVFD
jgi:hypothetical protein